MGIVVIYFSYIGENILKLGICFLIMLRTATWGSTFANMMIVVYFLYIGGNSLEVGDMLFDNTPVLATWGSTFLQTW